jgi:hypothetical protein
MSKVFRGGKETENMRTSVNRFGSRETGLEIPCCPTIDLLWVHITQSYPNRLRFSSVPCPQSPETKETIKDPFLLLERQLTDEEGGPSLTTFVNFQILSTFIYRISDINSWLTLFFVFCTNLGCREIRLYSF